MTILEYQKAAARTCPDLGSELKHLAHMKAGIATELGEIIDAYKKHLAYGKELDMVNIAEECADVCWYAANMSKEPIDEELINEFVENESAQIKVLSEMSPEEVIFFLLAGLELLAEIGPESAFAVIFVFMKGLRLDFYKALDNNINKLLVRYPIEEGFTADKALNRNLEAERVELEKK